ncbi:hypothetical protein [Bradyrhizobium sp. NP1]|uniref:hypothetical protein n=1 Tax=Bradyrhizobium sp. NP1 TaxID=3049772 RepID=UPI0025A58B76|nr:hypothetical protein [Bradyrhizobium sp. NP1]WJR74916.1 hypothetical protein QOU61_18995 [Bradyrhizobium sp. NP1]
MIAGGIELFTLRQRRSAAGDIFFTGRLGSALVVLIRDDVERDVWRAFACDPSRANDRDDRALRARAISAPADDHDDWNVVGEGFDDLPVDLDSPPSQQEGR